MGEAALLPRLQDVLIRPLAWPADGPAYERFGAALEPEDLRLRFGTPTRWSDAIAERLWRRDAVTYAAFDEAGEILGVAGAVGSEVAIAVRSDAKHHGLGRALLERILAYAVERGMTELSGIALAENRAMLALAGTVGFRATGFEGPMVSFRLCLP